MIGLMKFFYRRKYFTVKEDIPGPFGSLAAVYQVADNYLRFRSLPKEPWDLDNFLSVIPFVYESIPKSDRGLWGPVVNAVEAYIEKLKSLDIRKYVQEMPTGGRMVPEKRSLQLELVIMDVRDLPRPGGEKYATAEEDCKEKTLEEDSLRKWSGLEINIQVSTAHVIAAPSFFEKALTGGWKETDDLKRKLVKITAHDWGFKALLIIRRPSKRLIPSSSPRAYSQVLREISHSVRGLNTRF
ncbi:unnamed protein product [Penicillium pancosmium]